MVSLPCTGSFFCSFGYWKISTIRDGGEAQRGCVEVEGQTAFDVADEDILGYLEELQKRQNMLFREKQANKSPLIESTATMENNQQLKPIKSKETLLNEQKVPVHIESLEQEKVDEEEEGKKDDSSCSSEEEEEEDSESEAEAVLISQTNTIL
eukprot:g46020.t1